MFRVENLKKLAFGVGVTGGILTYIMINSVPYLLNKKIKQTETYKEVMQMIKNHPEAVKYLGEPIEDGHINVTKEKLYGSNDEKAWFTVPVKGPKSVGNLYYETTLKKDEEGNQVLKTELARVELTIQSVPGYKLLLKRAN